MTFSVKDWLKSVDKKELVKYAVLIVLVALLLKLLFGGVFGYSLVVIENGPKSSMWPTYDQGDLFVIHHVRPEEIHLGDVIVYVSATSISRGTLIIHRVVNITVIQTDAGPKYYYRVSGDNPITNNYVDPYNDTTTLIPYSAVKGKTVFLISKVGYVRLWLAKNQLLRIILIVALLALGLYLILTPEKKKEEEVKEQDKTQSQNKETGEKDITKEANAEKLKEAEVKKLNVKKELNNGSKSRLIALLVQFKEAVILWSKKQYKTVFGNKKNRIKFFIAIGLIALIIIAIPVIDDLISNRNLKTGIIDINNLQITDDPFGDTSIVYVSFTIHFQHDGTWNKVFKDFTVYGIQNNKVISVMKWYSFYQKEGQLEIGGSLVIPVQQFNSSSPLTISIVYTIHLRFGADHTETFTKTFNAPFS